MDLEHVQAYMKLHVHYRTLRGLLASQLGDIDDQTVGTHLLTSIINHNCNFAPTIQCMLHLQCSTLNMHQCGESKDLRAQMVLLKAGCKFQR